MTEPDVSEASKEYGPPVAPWLQGITWKGVRYPKDPHLKFAVCAQKEAHFRRKLAKTVSDEVRAKACTTKAEALSEAVMSLRAVGFFGGTRIADPAEWQKAEMEWEQAVGLPDAEVAAAAAREGTATSSGSS
jgi:hypothetical protein